MPAEDVFERLPDELICSIFSRSGTFHSIALSCSPVSRRWRSLSRTMDSYTFDCASIFPRLTARPLDRLFMLETFISAILLPYTGQITRLAISGPNLTHGTALTAWLNRASSTLQTLTLRNELTFTKLALTAGDHILHIFTLPKLVRLELCNWLFPDELLLHACRYKPRNFCMNLRDQSTSPSLTSVRLASVEMSDRFLEEFMKLCPVLKILRLDSCDGLELPVVVSNSLHQFRLEYVSYAVDYRKSLKNLTVVCPSLETVEVFGVMTLTGAMHGLKHLLLESACEMQAEVGRLETLRIKSSEVFTWSIKSFLSTMTTVAKLDAVEISVMPKAAGKAELVFSPFFASIGHCEVLEVSSDIFEYLSRDVERDLAEMPVLPFLRRLTVHIHSVCNRSRTTLSMITRNCSSLETVECFNQGTRVTLQPSTNHG